MHTCTHVPAAVLSSSDAFRARLGLTSCIHQQRENCDNCDCRHRLTPDLLSVGNGSKLLSLVTQIPYTRRHPLHAPARDADCPHVCCAQGPRLRSHPPKCHLRGFSPSSSHPPTSPVQMAPPSGHRVRCSGARLVVQRVTKRRSLPPPLPPPHLITRG